MKERFHTLDALRGCAAVVIVLYHSTALYSSACSAAGSCEAPFGYLAVDLFFALSGFVLAHSYDKRFDNGLTSVAFMRGRLARLLPIYLVGLGLGALPFAITAADGGGGGKRLLASLVLNIAFLPGTTWDAAPFMVDPPAWSLFFEIWVANVIFCVGHRFLRGGVLLLVLLLSLIWLLHDQAVFGSLHTGFLWFNFRGGFAKVIFDFFMGVLVYRVRKQLRPPEAPASLIIALAIASFWLPLTGIAARIFEIAAVALLYPFAIWCSSAAREQMSWLGRRLGEWSYALYVVHVPILYFALHETYVHGLVRSPVLLLIYVLGCLLVSAILFHIDAKWHQYRKGDQRSRA